MQEATFGAILAALISGLLSGGIAAWGAWYAVRAGVRDLEATERRRQKISCVINLYGLRYVLSPDGVQRDEDRTRFMFEIGRAAALFANDAEVQKMLRDFYAAVGSQSQLRSELAARQAAGQPDSQDPGRLDALSQQTTALLVALIKELSRSANFPVQSLSDSDVRNIFTMNLSNPAGISTVIVNAQSPQATSGQPPLAARLNASQLLSFVQAAVRNVGIDVKSIEPVYSRMPPPLDEPHVVKVKTRDGRALVVRTPCDMPADVVQGLISSDLKQELASNR